MLILALTTLLCAAPQADRIQGQSNLRSWPDMPGVGDVNGDGVPDLIHERDRALHLVSGADPTLKLSKFLVAAFYPDDAGPTWEVGPDVDGDGIRDVAILNGFALVSTIFIDVFSGRTGMSLGRIEGELPGHTMSIAWTDDVDGDGIGDIAITGGAVQVYSSKSLALLWSVRHPGWHCDAPSLDGGATSPRTQVGLAEDFDGDGIRDLAIGVKLGGESARVAQLAKDFNFSFAMLSGADGKLIEGAPRVPMEAISVDTFGWMSGDWVQQTEVDGRSMVVEETWSAPGAGMLLGLSRTSQDGARTGQFEFLRLSCSGRTVKLHPSPGGQPADPFRLKSYGATEAVFENLSHDFPQVIRYWQQDGQLHARIGTAAEPALVTFEFESRKP